MIPYDGRILTGATLLRQLDDWVDRGITEPSFAEAVGAVVSNPDWLDLRGRTFALVGAGAAMGPLEHLLGWGATVAALDIPLTRVWDRLTKVARLSPGRLLVPRRDGSDADDAELTARAGVDLLTETGAIVDWLDAIDAPLTVGNYGYLDGAAFVRLSVAFDVAFTALAERRNAEDLALAYLATPSDTFMVPVTAVAMARNRYHELNPAVLAARAGRLLSGGRSFAPNFDDDAVVESTTGRYGLVNAFIVEQGQNYALAKRLQRWRVLQARDAGHRTSVHVAPPTRTASVHSNPMMEQRQRLTALIGIETFDAATSRALGAALLAHDLHNPAAPAWPTVPLRHPHEIFMWAANPGGRWRVPLDPNGAVPFLIEAERARGRAVRTLTDVADRLPPQLGAWLPGSPPTT